MRSRGRSRSTSQPDAATSLGRVGLDPPDLSVLRSMSDMDETNPIADQPQPDQEPETPLIPSEPALPIESRFLFVDVAALRAKQLRRGARPRLAGEAPVTPQKAELVAMEEVRRVLVYYDIPAQQTPEGAASGPVSARS